MEPWKKAALGIIAAVIIWRSPAGSGHFVHDVWVRFWTFVSSI